MLDLTTLISPATLGCKLQLASKKKALEILSSLLAKQASGVSENQIFDSLLARERLGSTGLGKGIAIPHGRIEGLEMPLGALITLESGVDFDAPDREPVDMLFALAVPASCNQEHLQILAGLAELFSDSGITEKLRSIESEASLFAELSHWHALQTDPA